MALLLKVYVAYHSGLAQIIVEDSGQNSIVIVPGANNCLTSEDVINSRDTLSSAKIMLTVLEVPRQTVLTGLKLANELGGRFLHFNMEGYQHINWENIFDSFNSTECGSRCERFGERFLHTFRYFLCQRNRGAFDFIGLPSIGSKSCYPTG